MAVAMEGEDSEVEADTMVLIVGPLEEVSESPHTLRIESTCWSSHTLTFCNGVH